MKTKRVSGVDLPSSSFGYVGDVNVTNTWKHAIHVPGDERKTVNLIKNALARFHETKGIPEEALHSVWLKVAGAAAAHGIKVEQKEPQKSPHLLADFLAERFIEKMGY
jgi:hypothetical protein